MRQPVNVSFTAYEWKVIKAKMEELGMNVYQFGRYCIMKECGVEIDRESSQNSGSGIERANREPSETDNSLNEPVK
jgi:hypothetical protein